MLLKMGIQISMNGKGRCQDNVFVERLWRSLKYEEVYLKPEQALAPISASTTTNDPTRPWGIGHPVRCLRWEERTQWQ